MTESVIKVSIFTAAPLFLIVCMLWKRPLSGGGKLSLKLCAVNAAGWLLLMLLPFSESGHPPAWLFPTLLFWLVNLPLIPTAAVALWVCYKGREERPSYLAIASAYVGINVVVLFILPLVWLIRASSR